MPYRILTIIALLAASLLADEKPQRSSVNLPYTIQSSDGQQWIIQRGGWLQQQGNMPVYGQAANLTINGNGIPGNAGRGMLDKSTGELILDGLQVGGITVTRRILANKEENYVRYIDLLRGQGGEQTVQFMIQSSLNFGVNGGDLVSDPKREGSVIGWVAPSGAGPVAAEVWAGKNSKLTPEVNWQPGNSFVQATYRAVLPAGATIAIMHIHAIVGSPDAGEQLITATKENKLLAGVPADIRKAIVNFRTGGSFLGDRELLRGDTLDVVELRTGDQLRGLLEPEAYRVQTSFGLVELPAEKVIGVIAAGAFRPRQLVITSEGEIIGGTLKADSIGLVLSSGQVTKIPLSQITRLGYRKRDGEPEEFTFSRPMLVLRSGDKLAIEPPAEPLDVLTRCGRVTLPADKLAVVDLRTTDSGVHIVTLTDGSKFGGLVQAEQLSFKLASTQQAISLPVGAIAMLQMTAEVPEPAPTAAKLVLSGGDVLVAPLTGTLQLDTLFDTLNLNADEIVGIAPVETGGYDVQIALWDQTTVSGQLRDAAVKCTLAGLPLSVPLPLIQKYTQPSPRPSAAMTKRVRAIVADLNADDFARREQAEAQLVELGDIVVPLLQQWRGELPLEAQQRVDSVLKKLQKGK